MQPAKPQQTTRPKPTFKFTPYTPEKKEEFLKETDALLVGDGYYYEDEDGTQYIYDDDDEYYYDEDYDDEDYYSDSEDDYQLHPSYQSAFFKPDSPIGRFIQERNDAYKEKNYDNPYYKLLDWQELATDNNQVQLTTYIYPSETGHYRVGAN